MATSVLFQHGPILIPKTASLPPARGQDFNKKLQSFHINIVLTSFVDLEDTRATELDSNVWIESHEGVPLQR